MTTILYKILEIIEDAKEKEFENCSVYDNQYSAWFNPTLKYVNLVKCENYLTEISNVSKSMRAILHYFWEHFDVLELCPDDDLMQDIDIVADWLDKDKLKLHEERQTSKE